MTCKELTSGYDLNCLRTVKKYDQELVIINYEDLNKWAFYGDHIVYFNLKDQKSGFKITSLQLGDAILGNYDYSKNRGTRMYSHSISIPVVGISAEMKARLEELEGGKYFAALRFGDKIEIYGLEYGLEVSPYSYSPTEGGEVIDLVSINDEYFKPLIYDTATGSPSDFDNLFLGDGGDLPEPSAFSNGFSNGFATDN